MGLSGFIVAFSLLNLVDTLLTGINTRRQEIAMLQSIGMTYRQVLQMIVGEGLYIVAGNITVTGIAGDLAGYAMEVIYRYYGGTYLHYQYPAVFLQGMYSV